MPDWAIAIIAVVVGTILGFLLNLWRDKQQESERRRLQNLEIHFRDINSSIIRRLSEMTRSLQIRNNRLVFGGYIVVSEKYPFEQETEYESFTVHFHELTERWTQLNVKALEQNKLLKKWVEQEKLVELIEKSLRTSSQKQVEDANLDKEKQKYEGIYQEFNHSLAHLQNEFNEFARLLADTVQNIEKYQIGTVFKYNKDCPICKKF